MLGFAEYIWIDGTEPTQKLRSKTKVVETKESKWMTKPELANWNFDGSSTCQAPGDDSECVLKPVRTVQDPLRGENCWLVLCEVLTPDGKPHVSNQRAKLRELLKKGGKDLDTLWGFEQEYCLIDNSTDAMLGWPASAKHYPKPQGKFYCGVGADEVAGREIANKHAEACLEAGLLYYGQNPEVMLSQWEFQIGYRGFADDEKACPLRTSDHLWLARYLLYRIGEKHNVYATLDPKPKRGDWNGSGLHTNYSDKLLRSTSDCPGRMGEIGEKMKKTHLEHQAVYGYGNRDRQTGFHETAHYEEFSMGQANRGASIRIPNKTAEDGQGYIEDRRPAANADPYVITSRWLETLLS